MPTVPPGSKPHLLVEGTASVDDYTYPKGVRGPTNGPPSRERTSHGLKLKQELAAVQAELEQIALRRREIGISGDRGVYVEFTLQNESKAQVEQALKRLDRRHQGKANLHIELMATRPSPQPTEGAETPEALSDSPLVSATVFVPDGRLKEFQKLVEGYLDPSKDTTKGPKNQALVSSTDSIRRAVMRSFWTDTEAFPAENEPIWWEVWLRAGNSEEDRQRLLADFVQFAGSSGARVGQGHLVFTDRTVVLASATAEQLAASVELLDCVAELRKAKELASFFLDDMGTAQRREWADDFLARLRLPPDDAPVVCVLDCGITAAHPLLRPGIAADGVHSIHPEWGAGDSNDPLDRRGHGTEMAGLALYGDLVEALAAAHPEALEHRLESVKILPPIGYPEHDPELYGWVTKQGAHEPEVVAPHRPRVFALAVTATDFRDRGAPSSWSGELDNMAFGQGDGQRRLFVVSAGNIRDRRQWPTSPDCNDSEGVHDPAQAWNVLTVGAFTEKSTIPAEKYPGWPAPIAAPGGLAPMSATSVTSASKWPIKPDVVLEGGNAGVDPFSGEGDPIDELSLLTTHWQRLLGPTGDTSAACAQGARLAAILMARYPHFWPETIRALIVHSAAWTDEMRRSVQAERTVFKQHNLLLRRYGWGVPSLQKASWSANNLLTLVVQGELQPFAQPRGGNVPTQHMHLHELPWPAEALAGLPLDTDVTMRVTLSYFVEPNPGRRGDIQRHRYTSHGLAFSLIRPDEHVDEFKARVNKQAQHEGTDFDFGQAAWTLGERLRNKGSIRSDWWVGSGQALAACRYLAVVPQAGWWKERPHTERWREQVRYSLVVSIETEATEVDLYTPVATQIGVPVAVEVGT